MSPLISARSALRPCLSARAGARLIPSFHLRVASFSIWLRAVIAAAAAGIWIRLILRLRARGHRWRLQVTMQEVPAGSPDNSLVQQ